MDWVTSEPLLDLSFLSLFCLYSSNLFRSSLTMSWMSEYICFWSCTTSVMFMILFCSRYFKNCFRLSSSYSLRALLGLLSSEGAETAGDCLKFMYLLSLLRRMAFAFCAFYEPVWDPAELLAGCKSLMLSSPDVLLPGCLTVLST